MNTKWKSRIYLSNMGFIPINYWSRLIITESNINLKFRDLFIVKCTFFFFSNYRIPRRNCVISCSVAPISLQSNPKNCMFLAPFMNKFLKYSVNFELSFSWTHLQWDRWKDKDSILSIGCKDLTIFSKWSSDKYAKYLKSRTIFLLWN